MTQVLHLSSRWNKFLVSLLISIQSFVPVGGRSSPHNFEIFSISPLQAYSFRCWFSNNSVITFLERCFPSSFVAEIGIFFFILLSQWSIFYSFFRRHSDVAHFTHHLELWGSCSFDAYPFNRRVASSIQVLFILSSFASFLNRRAVWNPSYPLCHSFNSSGGRVLLISSSIIPSSQVHVLFLSCSTGVLPEFFLSHLVLTRVVSNSILSIKLLIHVFQPSSSCNVPCSSF